MTYNNKGRRPARLGVSRFRSQGRSGGKRGGSKGGFHGAYIDVAKFINKRATTDTAEIYISEHSFNDFKLQKLLKENIEKKGYINPTPIQDRCIQDILDGRDIVGIANTGTGKTAAFLIPLINKVMRHSQEKVLIVVPTRELANQIDEELRDFAKNSNLFSVLCIGGAGMGNQIRQLRQAHHFVIGTPGRLKDLMEQRVLDLSGIRTLVLDEADRMLDMGFIADIRMMISKMPKERHTLFFSATISSKIEKLISEFLKDPVRISVKTHDTALNVTQDIVRVPVGKVKLDVLKELLRQAEFSKVLVFGRTKHGVEKLSIELSKHGFKTESIHGNKRQRERQHALDLFKTDKAQVLIATDVAARGLDISDITHVINFDLPATYDDYVHRIGRTGRGDKKGKALTFV